MVDGTTLHRCFVDVLEDIRQSNFAVLDCVIVHRRKAQAPIRRRNRLQGIWSRLTERRLRRTLLYDLYLRWDAAHQPSGYALAAVESTDVLQGMKTIDVEPIVKGFVHRFPEAALQEIRRRDLDVILRFGFNILRGDVLQAARYGVWSFHHGDNEFYRGGPALFWEIWERNPLSGVILQRLTEELDAGVVLCKSVFPTAATVSLAENRHGPYRESAHFIIRKLNELHRFGYAALEAKRIPDSPYRGRRKLYRTPTNADMLRWIGRRAAARARRTLRPTSLKHWQIGIRKGGPFLDVAASHGKPLQPEGFRWIGSPKGRFYADPFLITRAGRVWLFVEDFDYRTERGRICVAEVAGDGSQLTFEPCLELPHHLSFPFVFEHGDEVYLVPESSAAHEVTLYRARRFPFEWTADRVLLRGDYVDTVIWQDGSWWCLTTVRETPGYAVHTLLFRADDLHGEWRLHPASPLFNDVRFARNGGATRDVDGRRFRVSQDGSLAYGYSFGFNEIVALDAEQYREREVARVTPDFEPRMIATHSYTRAGDWEVIDGCFLESRRRVVS